MGSGGSGWVMGSSPWILPLPPSTPFPPCAMAPLPLGGPGCPPSQVGGWTAVPWTWFPMLDLLTRSPARQLPPASPGPTLLTGLWASLAATAPWPGHDPCPSPSALGPPRPTPFPGQCQPQSLGLSQFPHLQTRSNSSAPHRCVGTVTVRAMARVCLPLVQASPLSPRTLAAPAISSRATVCPSPAWAAGQCGVVLRLLGLCPEASLQMALKMPPSERWREGPVRLGEVPAHPARALGAVRLLHFTDAETEAPARVGLLRGDSSGFQAWQSLPLRRRPDFGGLSQELLVVWGSRMLMSPWQPPFFLWAVAVVVQPPAWNVLPG